MVCQKSAGVRNLLIFLGVSLSSVGGAPRAHAEDFLDRPYRGLVHPVDARTVLGPEELGLFMSNVPARSEVERLISYQTPVKSQAARGTCSIFSAVGLLEGLLQLRKDKVNGTLDLSEEFLEYTVVRNASDDGSTSMANFNSFMRYGAVEEQVWPYVGEEWKTLDQTALSKERCTKVPSQLLKGCLLAHRDPRLLGASEKDLSDAMSPLHDPEFLKIKRRAIEMRSELRSLLKTDVTGNYMVYQQDVKAQLAAGVPLTLDVDFYYGAWNHRLADGPGGLGIGRDETAYVAGIVGYPAVGSVDRVASKDPKHAAGHSVVIVGYDDTIEIRTRQKMTDGSVKEFTHKGVYFIKNSWGTDKFGSRFELSGKRFPGFGVITQDYAHEFGAFFRFAGK